MRGFQCLLVAVVIFSGCSQSALEYTEVKRINEPVTIEEFKKFVSIVKQLPGKELPELPELYAPLPEWDATRTLSVAGLVREEKESLRNLWDERRIGRVLAQDLRLKRVLDRHEITIEQFVGLTQTIGLAVSRGHLRDEQDLSIILRRGQESMTKLEMDTRTYSNLTEDEQYYAQQQASWINRYDRARRLLLVPDSNIELVERNDTILREILPPDYFLNPFDPIRDLQEEFGMPFEELPESGSDADLKWSRESLNNLAERKARSETQVSSFRKRVE